MGKRSLFYVLTIHAIYAVYLVVIGGKFHCFGPAILAYAVTLVFSFTAVKRLSADPDQVLQDFIGRYLPIVVGILIVFVVFLVLNHLNSSAILSLIVEGIGLVNLAVFYFVCPLAMGPMLWKLVIQHTK